MSATIEDARHGHRITCQCGSSGVIDVEASGFCECPSCGKLWRLSPLFLHEVDGDEQVKALRLGELWTWLEE